MDVVLKFLGAIVLVVAAIFAFGLLMAFPLKWLWNWLMPDLFNLARITVWQAWGLLGLSGLLFKSASVNKSK